MLEEVEEEADNSRGRTVFPPGTLAEGYFNAFFKEECKLGMGANGSVFLCAVCINVTVSVYSSLLSVLSSTCLTGMHLVTLPLRRSLLANRIRIC